MPNLAELQEKRNKLAAEMRTHAEENFHKKGKKWDAEGRAKWDKLNEDYNALMGQLDESRNAEAVQKQLDALDDFEKRSVNDGKPRPGLDDTDRRQGQHDEEERSGEPSAEDRAMALQAWCRYQSEGELNKRQAEAAKRCGLNPRSKTLHINLGATAQVRHVQQHFRNTHPQLAMRALSSIEGTKGGFTVADGFVRQLEINMLNFAGMLQVADVMTTSDGADLPWPTGDDTSNEGEIVGQNQQVKDNQDPNFGAVIWKAFKFSSKMVRVPVDLFEDSAFDFADMLATMLGERLGRAGNRKFTNGTGVNEPAGILNKASLGITAASPTAIADTEIVRLIHSVDPAYRANAAFMAHDNVYLAVRLLKDSQGRFIWQEGLQAGQPDRLSGYATYINQHMPSSIAASAKSLLFGQLSKYKVRRVRSLRLRRLVERYADQDQEGFVAFLRQDGNLLDAGTAPVKYLQQAA